MLSQKLFIDYIMYFFEIKQAIHMYLVYLFGRVITLFPGGISKLRSSEKKINTAFMTPVFL